MGRRNDAEERDQRLYSAYHEAGHAVLHKVAGFKVVSVELFGPYRGVTEINDNEMPERADRDRMLGWLAMILGGQEAAARFLAKYHGYSHGSGRRFGKPSCTNDLAAFRSESRRTGISESRARNEALRLVKRHWGRIERTAKKLERTGRLSGNAV